jgi:hypothetical protein
VVEGSDGAIAESTRGARQSAIAQVARADPGDLPDALFNGRALGFGATRHGVENCSAGCACTSMHLVCARLAQPVLIRTGRSLSGSATPADMAGSAIVSICMLHSSCEFGHESRNCGRHFSNPSGSTVLNRWRTIIRGNRQPQTASRA